MNALKAIMTDVDPPMTSSSPLRIVPAIARERNLRVVGIEALVARIPAADVPEVRAPDRGHQVRGEIQAPSGQEGRRVRERSYRW